MDYLDICEYENCDHPPDGLDQVHCQEHWEEISAQEFWERWNSYVAGVSSQPPPIHKLEIEKLKSDEGNELGYYSKGHHHDGTFLAWLAAQYGDYDYARGTVVELQEALEDLGLNIWWPIKHEYWSTIAALDEDSEGLLVIERAEGPLPGTYPVTFLNTDLHFGES